MTTVENTRPARRIVRFARHYLEMVAAMLVGMAVLAPLWPPAWLARADVGAVVMATDMTVAMVAWMRFREHSWPRTLEMAAVMYLPILALLVPHWSGVLSGSALMVTSHVIMFPLMLAAMLRRRADYCR